MHPPLFSPAMTENRRSLRNITKDRLSIRQLMAWDGGSTASTGSGGSCAGEEDCKDAKIARLESLLAEQYDSHAETISELSSFKQRAEEDRCRSRLEIDELRKENDMLTARLAQMERDVEDRKALHEYASMIVQLSGDTGVGSAYVVRLQSKLCKAIHQRAVWSEQISLVQRSCRDTVHAMQQDVANAVAEKCRAEADAMNKIAAVEREKGKLMVELDGLKAACDAKMAEKDAVIAERSEEIEKLRVHLEMEKETRASLVSVCTEQRRQGTEPCPSRNGDGGDGVGKKGVGSSQAGEQERREQDERLNRLVESLRVGARKDSVGPGHLARSDSAKRAPSAASTASSAKTERRFSGSSIDCVEGAPVSPLTPLRRSGNMLSRLRPVPTKGQSVYKIKEPRNAMFRAGKETTKDAEGNAKFGRQETAHAASPAGDIRHDNDDNAELVSAAAREVGAEQMKCSTGSDRTQLDAMRVPPTASDKMEVSAKSA